MPRPCSSVAGDTDADPFSRDRCQAGAIGATFRFGVPRSPDFFGDTLNAALYREAIAAFEALGGTAIDFDYAPFVEVAKLLYEGPWVAERMAVVEKIYRDRPEAMLPVTRSVIGSADKFTAVDAFRAQYRLEELRRATLPLWREIDAIVLPTAPSVYTIDEVNAEPVTLNSRLGHYTNFVNLLDLAALAVPAGFRSDGLPFGVTLIAPVPGTTRALASLRRTLCPPTRSATWRHRTPVAASTSPRDAWRWHDYRGRWRASFRHAAQPSTDRRRRISDRRYTHRASLSSAMKSLARRHAPGWCGPSTALGAPSMLNCGRSRPPCWGSSWRRLGNRYQSAMSSWRTVAGSKDFCVRRAPPRALVIFRNSAAGAVFSRQNTKPLQLGLRQRTGILFERPLHASDMTAHGLKCQFGIAAYDRANHVVMLGI